MNFPYLWQPTIMPTQIFKIGNVAIIAVPAEFTTMSGRRLKDAVRNEFKRMLPVDSNDIKVVMTGLANAYSSYVTTFEEYQVQRYEAASTLYGPHTLLAYIHQYQILASHLAAGQQVPPGPNPPNLLTRQISLKPGVIFDSAPFERRFGDVINDALPEYYVGSVVFVSFISGHPRNDLQQEGTFLTVERFENETWHLIATDANWETK
jgi:neutral ceramidase